MPINITRLSLEAIGAQLGTVVPRTPTSSYTPFIRNNWVDTVTIDTTWMTVLASAEATGAEQRIQRRKRPVRTISARCTAMTQEDSVDMQMVIQEMQKKSSTAFPLYCDRSELTKNYNNDDTELYCDTRQRRFYKGQKILLVKGDYSRFQATSSVKAAGAYLFIEEVRSDSLVVAPLSYHFPAGSHVFPVIDVHPDLKMKTELLTDRYSIVKMKALEIEGKSCLPSSWAGATPPPGNLYEGHPIMEIRPNYATKVEQSFLRKGSRFKSGKGSHTALHADAPQIAFKYTDSNFSREEAWDLLRFFDSRQGRTKPFWVMQPLTFWEPLAITKTYIDVPDHNYIANMINLVKHIGIKDSSGTIHIKAVDEIINHPGQLFKDPEDFIDSTWSFSGDAEGVANTHLAPDGELTADSITANADDTVANVMQDVAITPTGDAPYTFSVHVKDRDPLLGPADNVQIIVYLLGPPTPPSSYP